MPSPTPQQENAIRARGDVVVLAGAGAGKTSTLVNRVLDRVLDGSGRTSVDRMLVVTFTEAAATEMRHRLRAALESRLLETPDDAQVADQLALLETAQVSTLHAFCLRLLREHFHELGLDPQFAVLDAIQAGAMRQQVLQDLLAAHFDGTGPGSEAIRPLLQRHGGDGAERVKSLVLRLHDHARTLPDAEGWLAAQRAAHAQPSPEAWSALWEAGVHDWAKGWRDEAVRLADLDPANFAASEGALALRRLCEGAVGADALECLREIVEAGDPRRFPRNTKGRWRDPLKDLFGEAEQVKDLLVPRRPGEPDPLAEDWGWARRDVQALLALVGQFGEAYAAARRSAAAVDFADLEQLALRLLCDPATGEPTALAREWRERFEWVLVDEYQDINGAQDRLITCLSRPGAAANRFFVGDVKQSVYRFRRADPRIFQDYARDWRHREGCHVLPLSENFRSHERILGFVNTLFAGLMRPEIGGVAYDAEAQLQFGAPEARGPMRERPEGRVEVGLIVRPSAMTMGSDREEDPGAASGADELEGEEAQAAQVARWLRERQAQGDEIWDETRQARRPVTWRDMVVLHPAPRPAAEVWARQFGLAGIPFESRRGGFFDAHEVSDLVNLTRLLDNPRQDLPLLAVLRSPLVGLSDAELAALRIGRRTGSLWDAVTTLARGGDATMDTAHDDPDWRAVRESARQWVVEFVGRLDLWRRLAREQALSGCLETVLAETGYDAWLRSGPGAEARLANVRKLLGLSRQFDQFQRHGLFRFLQFLEGQAEADQEVESAPAAGANRVQMMSIHQSKGLEFPVVALAGLGRRFNLGDLQGDWMIDDALGVCPPVVPPGRQRGYHSLPRWIAGVRQRREFLGEQIRLLYVACTRAAERLLLIGNTTETAMERWAATPVPLTPRGILQAVSPFDWIGPLLGALTGDVGWAGSDAGVGRWVNWHILRSSPRPRAVAAAATATAAAIEIDAVRRAVLRERLEWRYPYALATTEPAKAAVTGLTRRWRADEESAEVMTDTGTPRRQGSPRGSSDEAIERGLAHHLFFELVDLARTATREGLQTEIGRLQDEGWLSEAQAGCLDLEGLWGFWGSPWADRLRARPAAVHRELPFTLRLGPADSAALREAFAREFSAATANRAMARDHGSITPTERCAEGGESPGMTTDFLVVQGVVDLAVLGDDGIQIVDFKTDEVEEKDIPGRLDKYRLQVGVYAAALRGLYRRPVVGAWLYFVAPRRLIEIEIPR